MQDLDSKPELKNLSIRYQTGEHPLHPEQAICILETIEKVGLENLHLALTRLTLHSDCRCIPKEERDVINEHLTGMFMVAHMA